MPRQPCASLASQALLRQVCGSAQVRFVEAFCADHFAHVSSPTSPFETLWISNISS
jgi:hypothetical protein